MFDEMMKKMRTAFSSGKIRTPKQRKEVLRKLWSLIMDNENELVDSIRKDYCKSEFEFKTYEINVMLSEIVYAAENLNDWCSNKPIKKNFVHFFNTCVLVPEPLGVVLIISPWNFPLNLSIRPMIGAIAAGNSVVLKPSELTPNFSSTLKSLFDKYIDQDIVNVELGDKNIASKLLELKFDHIFYTGSTEVGKIVMRQAANNLIPVTLELGGKCPVYIDKKCNLDKAASRLAWAKSINCGQLCVSPDYVLCHEEVFDEMILKTKTMFAEMWKENLSENPHYGRIVNEAHCNRLKNLIDNTNGSIEYGGQCLIENKLIEPTIIKINDWEDITMKNEIFGPLLIVKKVTSCNEAIDYINKNEKPLSLYVFTDINETIESFKCTTSSGSLVINDIFNQMSVSNMPFGGIGQSGMGCYGAYYTFKTFSHFKPLFIKGSSIKVIDEVLYPPITPFKKKLILSSLNIAFP